MSDAYTEEYRDLSGLAGLLKAALGTFGSGSGHGRVKIETGPDDRTAWHLVGILALALFLPSCGGDRYEIHELEDGTVVRLDNRSGETSRMVAGRFETMETPEQRRSEREVAEELLERREFPNITIGHGRGLKVDLATAWKDDHLFYEVTIARSAEEPSLPEEWRSDLDSTTVAVVDSADRKAIARSEAAWQRLTSLRNAGQGSLTVGLTMTNGFTLTSIRIPLHTGTRIVDWDGDVTAIKFTGTRSMSASDYQSLESHIVEWQGDL